MPDLDIKSETVNKAIDKLVEPVYNDTVKPAIDTTKNALGFCSQFILSGIKPFMYSRIKECEYKIKEIDKKLEEKYNKIPDENKTEPRTNILGPAVDVLKYNLEEAQEYIQEMFINIISNDLDKSKQSKVLPSYIEIIRQLNPDDAKFLKMLKDNNFLYDLPIIRLKLSFLPSRGFNYISDYVICLSNTETILFDSNPQTASMPQFIEIPQIVLDNLLRLQIVNIPYGEYFAIEDAYNKTFETYKGMPKFKQYLNIPNQCITHEKCKLVFTDFGKNFIDICLS